MSISGLAGNQMVTESVASAQGYTLNAGQSNVYSDKCMTRAAATTRYYLEAANLEGASNQLMPSRAWVAGTPFYSFLFELSTSAGSDTGACAIPIYEISTLYSPSAVLAVGSMIYGTSNYSYPWPGGNNWWLVPSTHTVYQISNSGQILTIHNCPTASSISYYYYERSSSIDTVGYVGSPVTYYYSSGTVGIGTTVYTDAALTSVLIGENLLFGTTTSNIAHRINSSGVVIEIVNTTVKYNGWVRAVPAGSGTYKWQTMVSWTYLSSYYDSIGDDVRFDGPDTTWSNMYVGTPTSMMAVQSFSNANAERIDCYIFLGVTTFGSSTSNNSVYEVNNNMNLSYIPFGFEDRETWLAELKWEYGVDPITFTQAEIENGTYKYFNFFNYN